MKGEIIFLEQLYKMLHISKRKAAWMLQNGIIETALVKTMGEIPENLNLLATETAPTVALYKPGAGLLDKGRKESVSISQLSAVIRSVINPVTKTVEITAASAASS